MNPDRNRTEDTVGSYETIGRIVFRTCENSTPDPVLDEIQKKPNVTFFSLFNSFPKEFSNSYNTMELRGSRSDILPQITDQVIKNQDILDSLVKSSKSFTLPVKKENNNCDECFKCLCNDCSCDVSQELFPTYSSVDISTQTIRPCICRFRQFFSYIFSYIIKKLKI